MLKLFGNKVYPIGIDLGSCSLKMMQLAATEDGLGLLAAAKAEVPNLVRGNAPALQEWFVATVRELLSAKPFKGRKVVTCLPAREMLIQHLRMAKMEEDQLVKALPWEAQGKVPFDIHHALLRHIVAGEVYEGEESKLEVILMAASRNVVEQHLRLIERTRIEVECINVEPYALVNCFAHLLDRGEGQQEVTMFVDLGHWGTKVVVCHGTSVVFSRTISLAGEHLYRAIGEKLGVDYEEAVRLHATLEEAEEEASAGRGGKHAEGLKSKSAAGGTTAVLTKEASRADVEAAIGPTTQYLCEEIRSCVRYHDLMFHAQPAARVIFLGGLAKNKRFCQKVARNLGLPAQLGDPLARIDPKTRTGKHSDLETGEAHSDWAVAFGLSLGGKQSK